MNINYGSSRKKQCLRFILTPFLQSTRVFAMDCVLPCSCCVNIYHHNRMVNFYKIYQFIVELFMWITFLKYLSIIFFSDAICGSTLHLIPVQRKYSLSIFLILSLYHAMQASILNRRKLTLHLIKSSYEGELQWTEQRNHYMLIFLSLYFVFIVVWSFLTNFVYSRLKGRNVSQGETVCCTIWNSIWFFYANGQILSVLACSFITLMIVGKRLIHLSNELAEKRSDNLFLKIYLEDLIDRHSEIWEFFQHINTQWEFFMPVLYTIFMNFSSILLYAIIFLKMNFVMRICISLLSALVLSLCVCVSWALSYLTSLLYDNFVSVNRFSESNLKFEYKFKVIDFMKRFEGLALGFSMTGFFTIKKKFVIRMVSGIYSAFSTLIELTGVQSSTKTCSSNITSSNHI